MKALMKIAAIGAILAMAACARPAQDMRIQDPYAGAGGLGGVGASALPGTAEYFKASVGDTILFPLDQSTLTPEARVILANQAGWLNQNQASPPWSRAMPMSREPANTTLPWARAGPIRCRNT